jgi:HAD superfamily hydrolase (TIGR01458 family)
VLAGARAILIDLDGVLYVEDTPVAGAQEAVAELRDRGVALRFVTNTTAYSRDRTLGKLSRLGFDVAGGELVTPAAVAVRHCLGQGLRRVALVMNDEVKQDFAQLRAVRHDEPADAVIIGDLGSAFGYDVLNRAFRQVMDGAELIALQKNRYWLRGDGLSLDVGPFVTAIEYASGREAYVVGKPSGDFFREVLHELRIGAAETVMVGDDVESDIGGALRAGLRAVLVQTGKFREDRLRESGIEPTAVIASIAELPGLLAANGHGAGT